MMMNNFPTKRGLRRKRNWLLGWPMIIILVLVVGFLSRATWEVYGKYSLTRDNLHQVQLEKQLLQDQKAELTALTDGLKTKRGLEAVIRQNLPVAKPREKMIMVIDRDNETDLDLELLTVEPEPAWWDKLRFWRD